MRSGVARRTRCSRTVPVAMIRPPFDRRGGKAGCGLPRGGAPRRTSGVYTGGCAVTPTCCNAARNGPDRKGAKDMKMTWMLGTLALLALGTSLAAAEPPAGGEAFAGTYL